MSGSTDREGVQGSIKALDSSTPQIQQVYGSDRKKFTSGVEVGIVEVCGSWEK